MSGRARNTTERQMRDFFEQSVYEGYEQLLQFAEQLERALSWSKVDKAQRLYLTLNGFRLHNLLAKRRISSVENFLMHTMMGHS